MDIILYNTNNNKIDKFTSEYHKEYFLNIKKELKILPSDREIDLNKWYYYKYMDPFYSDKIIHLYSVGKIGNGKNIACVFCKKKGHIKSKCPKAKKKNLRFRFNF